MNDDVKKKIKIRNSLKVNYGFKVGFTGNLGKNHVTPRGLTSNKLNQLLEVNGIVTKISIVRPKLV